MKKLLLLLVLIPIIIGCTQNAKKPLFSISTNKLEYHDGERIIFTIKNNGAKDYIVGDDENLHRCDSPRHYMPTVSLELKKGAEWKIPAWGKLYNSYTEICNTGGPDTARPDNFPTTLRPQEEMQYDPLTTFGLPSGTYRGRFEGLDFFSNEFTVVSTQDNANNANSN